MKDKALSARNGRDGRNERDGRAGRQTQSREWRASVLAAVAGGAQSADELARVVRVGHEEGRRFREFLAAMEREGALARIRGDRYLIPSEADLFTGVIHFRAGGSAYVVSDKAGGGELMIAAEDTHTAMHGDTVVARVSAMSAKGERGGRRGASSAQGRVLRVLERSSLNVVGTLQKSKAFFYVVADDPRHVHNLYVPEPKPIGGVRAKVGDKVVARFEAWPHRHVNPEGRVVEVLGRAGAPGVDVLAILRKYDLSEHFPEGVLAEARSVSLAAPSAEAGQRCDLRDRFVLTVDPDDARDFDDAVEVNRSGEGWQVAVHIADVSHYVKPRTLLDREARRRGNSVYLPDRVLPMLPEVLSNGLCSLRPDEDRLVFSVLADVDPTGRVRRVRFQKSIIRSRARLTYREAFARLRGRAGDEISRKLHDAWSLASLLRERRFRGGSLDLDFPEVKVWLDERGRAERIERVENDISHQMIEELMLLANELVARELKQARQPAVYRIHEHPEADRLEELRVTAGIFGLKCGDLTRRTELQRLLAGARGKPFEHALKVALLKSLKRARYAPQPLGHYGLHKSDYTHFTSPIRRYADLVVHRALARHIGIGRKGAPSSELEALAEHISRSERAASDAERESVRMKKLEYFRRQIEEGLGEIFAARILEVRNFGLFVELPDVLLSGLVHISAIHGDFFDFDAVRRRLVGRKSRRAFQAGDEIRVVTSRVDMFKQQVDFVPV